MKQNTRFSLYRYDCLTLDGRIIKNFFIRLSYDNGISVFTDFHKYCRSSKKALKKRSSNNELRVKMIIQFLNYAFFCEGLSNLDEMSIDIAERFLKKYGLSQLPWDDEYTHRTKETVGKCIDYVLDFLILLIEDRNGKCSMKKSELYREVPARNKYGKAYMKNVPRFEVEYIDRDNFILRDIPNAAFDIMFNHVMYQRPELLGVFMLCSFGGLRPSSACNVRRTDSPLGPGIIFTWINGDITDIEIDLSRELKLRSDEVKIGGIKRKRMHPIAPLFMDVFIDTYEIYMEWLKKQKYEAAYAPFSVNSRGKALTYASFKTQFTEMIRKELVPIFLQSEDPEVVLFGQMCLQYKLGPHALRHWFTVQLVLSGINNPGTLMKFRGDKNPLSAIDYINNKGEIEKMYTKTNEEAYNYEYWKAARIMRRKEKEDN